MNVWLSSEGGSAVDSDTSVVSGLAAPVPPSCRQNTSANTSGMAMARTEASARGVFKRTPVR